MSYEINDGLKAKQLSNLFNKLNKDRNSVLFTAPSITNTILKKLKGSKYQKDKSFLNLYVNTKKTNKNVDVNDDDLFHEFVGLESSILCN